MKGSSSIVKTLDDGHKITEIDCQCGSKLTITHEMTTFIYCSCGVKHLNIAYFYINENGVLDFRK